MYIYLFSIILCFSFRRRLPIEIVRQTRAAVGDDFIIVYRLSMIDLVEDGQSFEEITWLAQQIEKAGATSIDSFVARIVNIIRSLTSSTQTHIYSYQYRNWMA
jgi:2,4-dienoyl-CoA reductase (NADPH2)